MGVGVAVVSADWITLASLWDGLTKGKLRRSITPDDLRAPTKGNLRRSISPDDLRVPDNVQQLNGRDIPFVNNVAYLGVTLDGRMTWRHHIERAVAKALRTYIRTYSLFKIGRLSTNIKLTLYKALIRSAMTYGCPTWEKEAEAHLLRLQCLQKRVLRAIGNLDRRAPVRKLQILNVYNYITKLCRTEA
jgi:hypothetical protein